MEWASKQIRAFRGAWPMTQEELGRRLQVTPRTVQSWENEGHRPRPLNQRNLDALLAGATPAQRRRYFETLGTAGDRLSLLQQPRFSLPLDGVRSGTAGWIAHDRDATPSDAADASRAFRQALSDALNVGLNRFVDPRSTVLDRRLFLRLWASLGVVAPLPLGTLERVASAFDRPITPDAGLIDGAAAVTASLRYAYYAYTSSPDELLEPTLGQLRRLSRWLDEPLPEETRRQATAVASDSADLSGWLAYVTGRRTEARTYFDAARELAQDVDDHARAARALGALSLLQSSMPRGGEGGDTPSALRLLEQATVLAGKGTSAPVRAWVAARAAFEHAASGEASLSDAALERADEALSQLSLPEAEPSPQDRYFAWDVAAHRASSFVLLSRPEQAEAVLTPLLASTDPRFARRHAFHRVDLAVTALQRQDIEGACRIAGGALDLSVDAGYALGVQRVRGLGTRLAPWRAHHAVRDLDDRLALVGRS